MDIFTQNTHVDSGLTSLPLLGILNVCWRDRGLDFHAGRYAQRVPVDRHATCRSSPRVGDVHSDTVTDLIGPRDPGSARRELTGRSGMMGFRSGRATWHYSG